MNLEFDDSWDAIGKKSGKFDRRQMVHKISLSKLKMRSKVNVPFNVVWVWFSGSTISKCNYVKLDKLTLNEGPKNSARRIMFTDVVQNKIKIKFTSISRLHRGPIQWNQLKLNPCRPFVNYATSSAGRVGCQLIFLFSLAVLLGRSPVWVP